MITITIVILTCLVSFMCFTNSSLFEKLQFNPYKVYHGKQYYRLITHALVHADWIHLIINMFVLWQFGTVLEKYFLSRVPLFGIVEIPSFVYFIIMYIGATIVASLTTLYKYKDVYHYNSVGASGAVSAVLFACIFFDPWMKLGIFFVIPMPGIIFGVLYLWYSNYMSKKGNDNINHDAHFLGAMFGFTFPILINPQLFYHFINQLINFRF